MDNNQTDILRAVSAATSRRGGRGSGRAGIGTRLAGRARLRPSRHWHSARREGEAPAEPALALGSPGGSPSQNVSEQPARSIEPVAESTTPRFEAVAVPSTVT